MKITMLGSGGVAPIPRPTCQCKVCREALIKGIPFSRSGSSLFVHEINLLFDTPEDVALQLNRERIEKVENVILTHWHPDHTHGIRVLEEINWDYKSNKPYGDPIKVYISKWQHEEMKKYSCGSFLDNYAKRGIIKLHYLEDGQSIIYDNGLKITAFIIEKTKGYYYLIEQEGKKIVYAPCEYHGFRPSSKIKDVDILIVHNLFWENKKISPRQLPPNNEDSFETMLKHADSFGVKDIILMHIEESFGLSHDEINQKMKEHYSNYNVVAGYDGLLINI